MHALLERLPDIEADDREAAASAWLARQAPELDATGRDDMLAKVLAILSDRRFADLFGPDALAEIPLAATVAGQVIAGTADRLLVREDEVIVVDFKTARRPPTSIEDIPISTLRQMAAYASALETIYPERRVRAAVLYTQTPQLFELPSHVLSLHKPTLPMAEESFAAPSVE